MNVTVNHSGLGAMAWCSGGWSESQSWRPYSSWSSASLAQAEVAAVPSTSWEANDPGESQSWRPCDSWPSGAAAPASLAQAEVDAHGIWEKYDARVLIEEAQFGS